MCLTPNLWGMTLAVFYVTAASVRFGTKFRTVSVSLKNYGLNLMVDTATPNESRTLSMQVICISVNFDPT